jgi:hypothetical protein
VTGSLENSWNHLNAEISKVGDWVNPVKKGDHNKAPKDDTEITPTPGWKDL